ncbi:MAG: hypothetical protein ACREBU_10135 [Nitrososphaera sp.]
MPWALILPFLQNLIGKFIQDPTERAKQEQALQELALKAKEAEARMEEAREESFARFIASTQPTSDNLYRWANTLIALVRPTLAVFTAVSLIAYTQKWLEILTVLKEAGIWGAIGISPLLVWVLGRDGLRMVLGVVGTIKNGGAIPDGALPEGIPHREVRAPAGNSTLKPAVKEPVWIPPDLPPVLGDNRNEIR